MGHPSVLFNNTKQTGSEGRVSGQGMIRTYSRVKTQTPAGWCGTEGNAELPRLDLQVGGLEVVQ